MLNDLLESEVSRRGRALPKARRARLIKLLERHGSISVADASARLRVSEMTIRRDLASLADEGLLARDHGGACEVAQRRALEGTEPTFELRARLNRKAKRAIADTALQLVKAGETIGIDTGSTTHAFAERLTSVSGLRIFSSNLRTAALLAGGASAVYSLGGLIRAPELSVFGPITSDQLKALWLDTVFIGAAGLMADGLYDFSLEDTEIKRLFIERAKQVVLLCDASKFGFRSLTKVADLAQVHVLVTDRPPDKVLGERFLMAGLRVVVASAGADFDAGAAVACDDTTHVLPDILTQPEMRNV